MKSGGTSVAERSEVDTDAALQEIEAMLRQGEEAAAPETLEDLAAKYPLAHEEMAKAAQREQKERRILARAKTMTVVAGQEPLSTEEIAAANVREAAKAQARLEQNEAERRAELSRIAAAELAREQDLLSRIDAYGGYSQ